MLPQSPRVGCVTTCVVTHPYLGAMVTEGYPPKRDRLVVAVNKY